jgi:CRISPR-associated protein Cas1
MSGILPYERDDSPAFVFDLMEPERPKIDRVVLDFVREHVCRLNPEMARMVVGRLSA